MRVFISLLFRAPVFLAVVAVAGCTSAPSTSRQGSDGNHGEVRVAAAADLKFALDEVVAEFRRLHLDAGVEVTYGSSGNFFAQLTNRAPSTCSSRRTATTRAGSSPKAWP